MDKRTKEALGEAGYAVAGEAGRALRKRYPVSLGMLIGLGALFVFGIYFSDQGSYYPKRELEASQEQSPQQVVIDSIIRAAPVEAAASELSPIDTGLALLNSLGLQGKAVYIVYGRPSKRGEATWGSLQSSTAEDAWVLLEQRRDAVSQVLDRSDITLNVLNPVYNSVNGDIADIYVQKALELAPRYSGVVAPSFNSIPVAKQTTERWEGLFSQDELAYLSVSLDIEHFPGHDEDAVAINAFSTWFAQKHMEWAGQRAIPGIVILYTMHGSQGIGRISNLVQLTQYYLTEQTLVIPIMDAYGSAEAKCAKVTDIVSLLPNTSEYPALVGIMEFRLKWGGKYDTASIAETFACLNGTPVSVLASQ